MLNCRFICEFQKEKCSENIGLHGENNSLGFIDSVHQWKMLLHLHPVEHERVIFFWSSGVIDCMFAHAPGGVSGVASFITTDEQLK